MDKDKIKGEAKDVEGRIERKVGEWTGDEESQVEGAEKQVEGKTQSTWGKIKEEGRELKEDVEEKFRSKKDRDVA